jgi:hypothetical protein
VFGGGIRAIQMFPNLIGQDQIEFARAVHLFVHDRPGADVMIGIENFFVGFKIEHLAPFPRYFSNIKLLRDEVLDHPAGCRAHDDAI